MNASVVTTTARASRPWNVGLWIAQVFLALMYIPSGLMKLTRSIAELGPQIPWTADLPEVVVRIAGAADLAAGLGLLLPALTRIAPGLTVWAAIGATVLQVCAIVLHTSRGEFGVLPINVALIAMQVFVAWGRTKKAPIAPRR